MSLLGGIIKVRVSLGAQKLHSSAALRQVTSLTLETALLQRHLKTGTDYTAVHCPTLKFISFLLSSTGGAKGKTTSTLYASESTEVCTTHTQTELSSGDVSGDLTGSSILATTQKSFYHHYLPYSTYEYYSTSVILRVLQYF